MQRTTSQAERERKQAEALITHYREIGPAAILAALACAQNNAKPQDAGKARTWPALAAAS